MNIPPMPAELAGLLEAYCLGELTPRLAERLTELARTDEQSCRHYVRFTHMHALAERFEGADPVREAQSLEQEIARAIRQQAAKPPSPPAGASNSPVSPVLGFLGGAIDYVNHSRMLMFWLMALALTGWFAFQLGSLLMDRTDRRNAPVAGQPANPNPSDVSHRPGGPFVNTAIPRQNDPVALLTADVDCHWRVVAPAAPAASAPAPGDVDTSEPFHVGSELFAGEQLDLARGLAEITFNSGARIVLNGPAHFTVGSKLGGKLQVGKLTARVPHKTHGFTIESPAGKVVDLGTEFGVQVAADHSMIVQVFVGEVAVDSSSDGQSRGSSEKVTAGHAAKAVLGQPVVGIPSKPNRFVVGLGPREDPRKVQAAYLNWMRSLNPVVWFRMEGDGADRVLHDEIGGPDAKLYWDGPGNPFVKGRVGKGLWLRGMRLKDCAILHDYPKAEHGKLSVSAWAYAESRPRFAVIAGNWSDHEGQFQLGLSTTGQDLAVGSYQKDGQIVEAREGPTHPFPLYQWQHVAFTIDGSMLRLYRQGREVASIAQSGLQYPDPVRGLGIGNRTGESGEVKPLDRPTLCWWDGRLDEVAIFNEVLSPEDIQALAAAPPW